MKLAKPKLSKPEAALEFAEAGKKKQAGESAGGRVFHAPAGYRRLTINLPVELHKRLKLAAIQRDCTATDIIERLLEQELAKDAG
jgi:hypothetical protein